MEKEFISQTILAKDTKINHIYITRGGTIQYKGKSQVWGFDRVRVKRKTNDEIIVQTPWGTNCGLPLDYTLYTTPETQIFEAHPLRPRGQRNVIAEITFQEALKCKLEKINKITKINNQQKSLDTKITQFSNEEEKIIILFQTENTVANVAGTLGMKPQIVRNRLNKICRNGYTLTKTGKGYSYILEKTGEK